MKKTFIGITLAAVLVAAFAFTGSVYAQAEVPPQPPVEPGTISDDPLYLNHDEMVSALADLTGLTVEDIESRIAAGETAYDIAISQGVAPEDFYAILPMGGFGMQAAGLGLGQAEGASALRYQAKLQSQLQLQDQSLLEDGECLTDGVPAPQNLNLEDGTGRGGANRGGRGNR